MDFNVDDAKALSTEIGTDAPDEFYEPRVGYLSMNQQDMLNEKLHE